MTVVGSFGHSNVAVARGGRKDYFALQLTRALVELVLMKDQAVTLADLKRAVLEFAQAREWEQFHSPKNLSMAIAAESAELMEHFLWADSEQSRGIVQGEKRSRIEEELADVIIFALEFANMADIDLATAIEQKMALNGKKYPVEKARGRSEKYTEL